ncbi:hypothetical protein [Paenibacillus ginsengihumi]|nr:hypothetical protein [Paenibacillus ginsengihumi]
MRSRLPFDVPIADGEKNRLIINTDAKNEADDQFAGRAYAADAC